MHLASRSWWLIVVAGVVLFGTPGCKWFHSAEQERHEKAAEEAAKELNFGEMIKEGKKAAKEEEKAEKAPLP